MIAHQSNFYQTHDNDLRAPLFFDDSSTTSLIYTFDSADGKQFMSQPQYSGLQQLPLPQFNGSHQAFEQDQTAPRGWAAFGDNEQASVPLPQSQQNFGGSRKYLSNQHTFANESDSYGNSPHMNQHLDQGRQFLVPWDARQQSPSSPLRHLPTPSHTPTQDSFSQSIRQQQVGRVPPNTAYELPVTPRTMNGDDFDTQVQAPPRTVPKFNRTISDVYQDELYNPSYNQHAPQQNFNSSYLRPSQQQEQQQQQHNHHPSMVNERLQAAHQARSASPGGERLRAISPFRPGSQAYKQVSDQLHTAADDRLQQKANSVASGLRQHQAQVDDSEPNTISPKDAVLDYKQDPDDAAIVLFPQPQTSQPQQASSQQSSQHLVQQTPSYAPHDANRDTSFGIQQPSFDFGQSQAPMRFDVPNSRYGPVSFQPSNSQNSQLDHQALDFPAHLVSMETSKSEDPDDEEQENGDEESNDDDDDDDEAEYDETVKRPSRTTADTGTYTCTYHGCSERFESPARLQKHKREDHRSTGHGGPPAPSASPSAPTMTQAGPHRCDRINPQTGKPCNTVFSRPYDLTRHEDTIHNRQKTKVRCHLCTDEKTFSRSDALTRHMKVVHPTAPWPAKHKKRGV